MQIAHPQIRGTVRLRIDKGIVFLRAPGVPSLACSLTDLSERGCNCIVCFKAVNAETAGEWRELLEEGQILGIDLSSPPHLPGLHLEAEVRQVATADDGNAVLDLRFQKLQIEESGVLKKGLLSLASTKLGQTAIAIEKPVAPSVERPQIAHGEIHQNDPFRGKRLGDVLVALGKLKPEEVTEAERASKLNKERIGHYMLRRGWVSGPDLCGALALQSGLPVADLGQVEMSPAALAGFSYLTMLKHGFVPFEQSDHAVAIALATYPLPQRVVRELEQRCRKQIQVYLAEDDLVTQRLYSLLPEKARKHRKHVRYELNGPIAFQLGDRRQGVFQQPLYDGRLVNISEGGLCFRTSQDLRRKDVCLKCCLALPPHTAEGVFGIRFIHEAKGSTADQMPFRVGIEVLEMTPEERQKLKQICIQIGLSSVRDRSAHRRGR